jgi:uncharacterized membrane protein YcaP (DUF421 family)
MDGLFAGVEQALGLHAEPRDFTLQQVILRAAITYLVGLAILRLGRNRFLARESAFDVVLAFILGSVLSRAINGTSPFLLSLAASVLLIGMHQLFAWLSYRSPRFERLIDGEPDQVVRDGRILEGASRRHLLSNENIRAVLRRRAQTDDLSRIEAARVEVNGEVSFIPRHPPPRIVDIRVEDGVQVVRLELS